MITNRFVLLTAFIITLIISPWKNSEGLETKQPHVSQESGNLNTCAFIKLDVNLKEQQQIQAAVDNGHQPWRLSPVDVAHAAISTLDKNVEYDSCRILSETGKEARVECRAGKMYYIIQLKRLVRPNGIWTAVSIESRT